MTRILVIVGNPIAGSFSHALAASYRAAATAGGADVRMIDLATDPIPAHPTLRGELRMPRADHPDDAPLTPDVAAYMDDVTWADHLVFFYPQWWGTYPAVLKSFIDRVFLSGFAFRYRPTGRLWDRLLVGRTARVVMTMDSPRAWNRLVYRNASETSLTRATLGYCGIRTVGVSRFGEVRHTTLAARERWLRDAARFGTKDAALHPRREHHTGGVAVPV